MEYGTAVKVTFRWNSAPCVKVTTAATVTHSAGGQATRGRMEPRSVKKRRTPRGWLSVTVVVPSCAGGGPGASVRVAGADRCSAGDRIPGRLVPQTVGTRTARRNLPATRITAVAAASLA